MVFDPEQHQKDGMAFLGALRQIAGEWMASGNGDDPIYVYVEEAIISSRAGLRIKEGSRSANELQDDGLIEGTTGPQWSLTRSGCRLAGYPSIRPFEANCECSRGMLGRP